MRKLLFLPVVLILLPFFLFFSGQKSFAQNFDFKIADFNSDITITKDGTVNVIEKITVNFKDEMHGVFRIVPYAYNTNDGKYYTKISVNSVTRDGKEEDFETDKKNSNLSIRIGDEDKTISGAHTYTVNYDVVGILRGFENHDELYWNVTGNYWEVPIENASATVSIEKKGLENAKCFKGEIGSTDTCSVQKNGSSFSFSTKNLSPGQGMTIVTSFPKNSVPLPLVDNPLSFFEQITSPNFFASFFLTLLLGVGAVIWNWAKRGRDFILLGKYLFDPNAKKVLKPLGRDDVIVTEYTPPKNLKPAQIGVLTDEKADTLDVTATIVDLGVKGYLKIKEIPKKWKFGKIDYELTRTGKKSSNLNSYEKELLSGLFESGKTVKVSFLKKKFYDNLKKVKEKIYQDVVDKNYFPSNPEKIKNLYFALSVLIIIVGFALFIFNLSKFYPSAILTGISTAVFLVGLFALIISRSMSRRTAKGAELYRRTKGYRLFLENVEKNKQKFLEDKNLFNSILPYAIVFGLTDKIADSMKKMGIKPSSPTWYSGAGTFNAAVFASNISAFSNSVSSSIASAPSSSGFSGSSGGGFGGGGGGGW